MRAAAGVWPPASSDTVPAVGSARPGGAADGARGSALCPLGAVAPGALGAGAAAAVEGARARKQRQQRRLAAAAAACGARAGGWGLVAQQRSSGGYPPAHRAALGAAGRAHEESQAAVRQPQRYVAQ